MTESLPPFQPHPWLRSGHAQTLAGFLLFKTTFVETAQLRCVRLDDGDQVVLHDDCPPAWQPGGRTALLMHGLAGCHDSPYMQRIAHKLRQHGLRTFRMDLRGCGAGHAVARFPYHSGRSDDAAAALRAIAALCPQSPTSLIGFSLSGNIALKLLGEAADNLPENLDRAVAVSPPIDLLGCVKQLQQGANRFYDRYFVQRLLEQIETRRRAGADVLVPDGWPGANQPAVLGDASRSPSRAGTIRLRGMADFDAAYTAPLSGFGTAENYYRLCSSAQFIPQIRLPTLILASADDPLLPCQPFLDLKVPPAVTLQVTERGGHLGFISRPSHVPDRRWMDWRVVDWIVGDA